MTKKTKSPGSTSRSATSNASPDLDLTKDWSHLDPEARREEYEKRVAQMYDRGKAVNFATAFEIDEVIDPMDTRHWILSGLKASPAPLQREGKKRPFIDTW